MENIRIYEEDGYIHFIMRPEDLMRRATRPKRKRRLQTSWTAG